MPEEPDVSPEEMEILDRVWRKRIEAKKQERQREAEQIDSIAGRILAALRSRPEGMEWAEIRALFDKNLSDKQIRQALLTLKNTALPREQVHKNGDHSCERWALMAAS
jgi:hypothetical protein